MAGHSDQRAEHDGSLYGGLGGGPHGFPRSCKGVVQAFGPERRTRRLCKAEQALREVSTRGLHGLMSESTGTARPVQGFLHLPPPQE